MVQRKATKKQNSHSNPIDVTKSDKRPTKPSSSLYQDIKSKAGGGGAEVKKKTMKKTRSIRVPPRLENLSIDKPVKRSPNYMRPTSCSESRQVSSPSQTPPKASKASSSKIFTRKSSLRPIRPSMKKSSSSSNRATCSSTLKDSKFPANLDLNVGGTESEGTSVLKVCPYTYCSLNGHHHHEPLPPLKRFVNARRRSLKAQKSLRSRGGGASKSRNRGVEKATDDDFFVEIYAERKAETETETEMSFGDEFDGKSDSSNGGMGYLEFFEKERSNRFGGELGVDESVFEWVDMDWEGQTDQYVNGGIDSGVDDVESHTINIVGGTSESTDEDNKPNDVLENPSMESLEMGQHVPFVEWIGEDSFEGVTEEIQDSIENHESDGDSVLEDAKAPHFVDSVPITDLEGEIDDIKQVGVVGDSIEIQFSGSHEVPLETEQGAQDNDSESEENQAQSKNRIRANQRRAREVSNQAKERGFNPRAPNFLPVEPDQEGEKVDLKHGMVDERKNSEEWMVDYALRQAVDKLAPKRRKKVALLVEAFETVLPTPKWEAPRGYVNGGFTHTRTIQACS
ncbi:hypothetical protein QJS04_geneDACA016634 [Acorus gramineus]|uniref:Calmodulin-binding domain-containing protein n=1 Tax=Acorus gramineus TaxID=55184 RepID=A0AAV9BSF8_ACOGR|nr:hypothetical protein QJS04_geneDACA016634 [Acorus gramineus]